jgi:AbrB family looped-hinge helix DNA binding protein
MSHPFLNANTHAKVAFMIKTLTVDKAGRVVLPKPVREELQLSAGDSLELESSEDQIVLRPVRGTAGLRKKQGIWVFQVGEPISAAAVDRTIRDIRKEREQSWVGDRIGREPAGARARSGGEILFRYIGIDPGLSL